MGRRHDKGRGHAHNNQTDQVEGGGVVGDDDEDDDGNDDDGRCGG